jgi:GlpG protein
MRQIGTIGDEAQARRLADYLLTKKITTRLDSSAGGWIVWVHDEDRVAEARQEFEAFVQAPDDPRYRDAASQAQNLRKKAQEAQREHERQSIYLRDRWLYRSPRKIPITLTLIAISVVTFVLTDLAPLFGNRLETSLFITSYRVLRAEEQEDRDWKPALWREHLGDLFEIRQGEVWRLITPIFLHGGLLHLLFNMFWLADLGSQIESLRKSWRLALLVVVIAAVSNLAQFLYEGPYFGGMSGVVYGLFGYTWMKVHYDEGTLFRLRPNTVPIMIIWLLLCMTGWLGAIADAAHIAGLVTGMLIGVIPHARDALSPW